MASTFQEILADLEYYGFLDVVLPFILVFTIIFAILEKTKLMGLEGDQPKTNINVVLSLVISFIVIANTQVIPVIRSYLSNVGLIIVIALIALILFGLLGVDVDRGLHGYPLLFAVIVAIIGILWALRDQEYLGINLGRIFGSGGIGDNAGILIGVAFILFVVLALWHKPKGERERGGKTFSNWVDEQLKNPPDRTR